MATIEKNSAVYFNYTLTDETGAVIDQSPEGQPLAYLHGHKNIITGLEKELEGKSAGEQFIVTIEPKDAYGEYEPQAVQEIPREKFQGVDNIEVGMEFESLIADGGKIRVRVIDVTDGTVIVDANYPLAGKTLTFDVEIVEVRSATEEELAHGHIHGVGGVEH